MFASDLAWRNKSLINNALTIKNLTNLAFKRCKENGFFE
jgi:hypothetical protein